jgi:hypothetical protein
LVQVIHIRDAPTKWQLDEGYVYIGRPNYFGNPFPLKSEKDRDSVYTEYRNYFYRRLFYDTEFRAQILALHNKVLVCYCKPKRCHGDVIVEFLHSF